MNTTTLEEKGELITLEQTNTKALFDGSGMDSMLAQIEQKARSYDLDISTPSGRKEVASVAYKIAQSKTAIDNAGKKLVEGIKAEAKIIDDERKKARDFLDRLKDEVRQPLTDFENAEKERIFSLEARLGRIEALCLDIPEDSGLIKTLLHRLGETDATTFEEFEKRATGLIAVAKEKLTEKLAVIEKREAEAKELERLRAESVELERIEREAKIARNAAEKARIETQAKAKEDAAKAKADSDAAIAKAEGDAAKVKRDADAAIEAERARIRWEQESERKAAALLAEQNAKKAANKKHRAAVIAAVIASLVENGVDPACASHAIELIAEGKIPAVSIQF